MSPGHLSGIKVKYAVAMEQGSEVPYVARAGRIPVLANLSLAGEKRKSNGVGNFS